MKKQHFNSRLSTEQLCPQDGRAYCSICCDEPMQETKQKEIREKLSKDLEDLFNKAGILFIAFVRNEISEEYMDKEIKKYNLEGELMIDKALSTLLAERDAEVRKKYDELIIAVDSKYPNETRHETALRYIQNAER